MFGILVVCVGLLIQAALYARFLNQGWVYRWYYPDRIWVVVIGGDFHVGLAIAQLMYALGAFAWQDFAYYALCYTGLHIIASIPIVRWQMQKAATRRRVTDAI